MGKKGQQVFTGGGDEAAIARGVFDTYQTANLRYSQLAPLDMYKEIEHRHQPAGADRDLRDRRRRLQVPVHGQGRRLGQQEPTSFRRPRRCSTRRASMTFLDAEAAHARHRGLPAVPPRDRRSAAPSAEYTLKIAKLASARYLDDLPTEGNELGPRLPRSRARGRRCSRSRSSTGIGAQFGGKYFCHDVRVDPPAAPRRLVPGRRSRCRARPTARRSARSRATASSSSSSRPIPRSTCPRSTHDAARGRGRADRSQPADERDPRRAVDAIRSARACRCRAR